MHPPRGTGKRELGTQSQPGLGVIEPHAANCRGDGFVLSYSCGLAVLLFLGAGAQRAQRTVSTLSAPCIGGRLCHRERSARVSLRQALIVWSAQKTQTLHVRTYVGMYVGTYTLAYTYGWMDGYTDSRACACALQVAAVSIHP